MGHRDNWSVEIRGAEIGLIAPLIGPVGRQNATANAFRTWRLFAVVLCLFRRVLFEGFVLRVEFDVLHFKFDVSRFRFDYRKVLLKLLP